MKKNILYFTPLVLALVLYVVVELVRPKPIDWTPTYAREDKIPFGTYIMYKLLPDIFPGQPVVPIDVTIYETMQNAAAYNGSNYVFVNQRFALDSSDVHALLEYVSDGGRAFISAENIASPLSDSLGFEMDYQFSIQDSILAIRMITPALSGRENIMQLNNMHMRSFFSSFDTATTIVLGMDQNDKVNFIKIPYGDGEFYLHSVPKAFTNYAIVHDDSRYVSGALSYLPVRKTLWDEHYKEGKQENQSLLRYIFSNRSLQWAWRLGIVVVVLFMLFEARRRQRIIPIVQPPANATLDFVTTVGKLYFQHGDLRNIADKKITYFLDYLRTRLNVPTFRLDNQFVELAAGKSGIPEQEIRRTIDIIRLVQSKTAISDRELLMLHEHIENFYKKSAR